MSNKLYVGNISWGVQEDDLSEAFSQYGEVKSVKIIKDHDTGRSKGFGFIEMNDASQAQTAIENLDGKDVGGRALRVNVAQDKPRKPRY